MPKLYDFELSPECYQVRLLASLLHVGLEIVPVDAFPGREHRRAPFLALNPLGEVPVLVEDELVLRDSVAILVHLARRHDPAGTWFPVGPAAPMAELQAWLGFSRRLALSVTVARDIIATGFDADLEACQAERYDIEVLAHRFGASFEQVCHRLTTLRRRGKEGVPFHMLRIDIAGNISKRFSGDGIRFARFSGACPRWNVHAAFLTPGMIRVQLSRMVDGVLYFCVARTVRNDRGGYHAAHVVQSVGLGCRAEHARELVYADGVDLSNLEAAVTVGTTCRLCEHADCEQRVFPALHAPGAIDENVRGVSFYAPVDVKRKKLPVVR